MKFSANLTKRLNRLYLLVGSCSKFLFEEKNLQWKLNKNNRDFFLLVDDWTLEDIAQTNIWGNGFLDMKEEIEYRHLW